jgi:hypothetical protein
MAAGVETSVPADEAEPESWRSRAGRWLKLGAVPLVALVLLYVAAAPAFVLTAATEWVEARELALLDIAFGFVLVVLTIGGLAWAFTRGALLGWVDVGRFDAVLRAAILTSFAVGTFASLTGLLYLDDTLELRNAPKDDDLVMDEMIEFYAWHLVNTVPTLDVASTLNWQEPFSFDQREGGLLLIAFKGLVILPLIQIVRLIVAGPQRGYEHSVVHALQKGLPNEKVRKVGSGRTSGAFVGEAAPFVFVDVMQQMWNEDPAIDRLDVVVAKGGRKIGSYALVVDAVGEAARPRIAEAFAEAPFEARLVVWRSDQSRAALIDAVSPLLKPKPTR